MIDSIEGKLLRCGLDHVSLGVSGVGLKVQVTPYLAESLNTKKGHTLSLLTEMIVREDSLTLYGFETDNDREAFRSLMGVSGIGPRTALAALSVLSGSELAGAIETQDLKALQRIPGVGKKSAQRIILELAGKMSVATDQQEKSIGKSPAILEALTQLGWTNAQAEAALENIESNTDDPAMILRLALQWLGARHGR